MSDPIVQRTPNGYIVHNQTTGEIKYFTRDQSTVRPSKNFLDTFESGVGSVISTVGAVFNEYGANFGVKGVEIGGKIVGSIGFGIDVVVRGTDDSGFTGGDVGAVTVGAVVTGSLQGAIGGPPGAFIGGAAGFLAAGAVDTFNANVKQFEPVPFPHNHPLREAAINPATAYVPANKCFPSKTSIHSVNGPRAISSIIPGEAVHSFDPSADCGRGELVPKKVVRTFTNITEEWLRLTWVENGAENELVTTPGHEFLTAQGGFKKIEKLLAGGTGSLVLADGSAVEVRSERLIYSAETADMFEQAEGWVYPENGNLALAPVYKKGWKTYNFEVEDFHTYVAGGVRVHNDSWEDGKGFEFGAQTEFSGEIWTSGYNGTEIGASRDGRALSVDVNDFLNYQSRLSGGYRDSPGGQAEAAGYAAARSGHDSTSVRAAVTAQYLAKGGGNDDPLDIVLQDAAYRKALAAHKQEQQPSTGSSGKGSQGDDSSSAQATAPQAQSQQSDTGSSGKSNQGEDQPSAPAPAPQSQPQQSNAGSSGKSGGSDRQDSNDSGGGGKPMLMDLDGDGIQLIERTESTVYLDIEDDGYKHQTAWAGQDDGVLFIDLDGDNEISERKEVIFTDWLPAADTDAEALRRLFDSNNDGILDAGDDRWSEFKVMVTGPDGRLTAKTLTELGIVSIDLDVDRTGVDYADGSSIDGETTFTRSDGTTGRAATATLSIGEEGYSVTETSEINGDGDTVVTQTLFNTAGELAQIITRTSSPEGLTVTVEFDSNADGVADRVLSDITVINGDGSRTRTETSRDAGGVLIEEIITTTSADLASIVIERDEAGGGYPTQRESRVTAVDNSFTVTIENLSPDGTVLNSTATTHSADRLTKTVGADADGNSIVERKTVHQTVNNTDGSRVETDEVQGGDGSLLNSREVTISADQQRRTEVTDLDGDGFADLVRTSVTSEDVSGTVTTVETQAARDGTVFAIATASHSADGLRKTVESDLDGDGNTDRTESDVTVVDGSDTETRTMSTTAQDGTLLSQEVDVRNADGLTGTLSRDTDGNDKNDQVIEVSKDAAGIVTEKTTFLATDGELVISSSEKTTSADGLTTITKTDLDGDGVYDRVMSDVVVLNADGSATQTVDVRSAEGAEQALISREQLDTSADGMVQTRQIDTDADGSFDQSVTSTRTLHADDSQTEVVETKSSDGTLIARTSIETSADRQTISETRDSDGDGQTDFTLDQTIAADGTTTVEQKSFANDGTLISSVKTTTSGTGLLVTVEEDADGDGLVDLTTTANTVLGIDGSSTQTTSRTANNGALLSREISWTSGNKMEGRVQADLDGDDDIDTRVDTLTSTAADGTVTTQTSTWNGSSLVSTRSDSVSADGLTTTVQTDNDGDGSADLTETTSKVLNADGSTATTSELRESTGAPTDILRSSSKQTVSANGRIITTEDDLNGDGHVDRTTVQTRGDNGGVETLVSENGTDNSLIKRSRLTTSADGLLVVSSVDLNGDGNYDVIAEEEDVLNADGSVTKTARSKSDDGTVHATSVSTTSGNELNTTLDEDLDGDGNYDRSTSQTTELAADGSATTQTSITAQNGALLSRTLSTSSGDGRSSSQHSDIDGDGLDDSITSRTVRDDGSVFSETSYFGADGQLLFVHEPYGKRRRSDPKLVV